MTISSTRLAELLEQARKKKAAAAPLQIQSTDKYGNVIQYNAAQAQFISLASQQNSCVLLGAAGTGKTTCQKGVINRLLDSGRIPILKNLDHKFLKEGAPGIVITSFTRRAVSNIKRNVSGDMKQNCITIHKLLEYAPVYYEVFDEASGEYKNKMSFEPTRTAVRPLPPEIAVVIIEESSMVSMDLFYQLTSALPHNPQYIFLGDIHQLPPTFGMPILGRKMWELRSSVIELTEVYRQALDSPIIKLAHRILSGNPILPEELPNWHYPGRLKLHPWKKKLDSETACLTAAKFLIGALDSGAYNPETDAVLCPFNKAFGTLELNKHIANHLARKQSKFTYEVIAGFNKHYFSVGDVVMFDKEDGVIQKIEPNEQYLGKRAQPASTTLDYWGYDSESHSKQQDQEQDLIDIDLVLAAAASDDEDKVNQASHKITVYLEDSERTVELSQAAQINTVILGYALTVHKSQGSEWDKVFLLLHQSHSTMIQRELLYTAVTRAKQELYVICEPETFKKGITSQRIKGNTLEEKIAYFESKLGEEY